MQPPSAPSPSGSVPRERLVVAALAVLAGGVRNLHVAEEHQHDDDGHVREHTDDIEADLLEADLYRVEGGEQPCGRERPEKIAVSMRYATIPINPQPPTMVWPWLMNLPPVTMVMLDRVNTYITLTLRRSRIGRS